MTASYSEGVELIAAERTKQIEEDTLGVGLGLHLPSGTFADAATALLQARGSGFLFWPGQLSRHPGELSGMPSQKGVSRKEQLIRAGALVAAELDRLLIKERMHTDEQSESADV